VCGSGGVRFKRDQSTVRGRKRELQFAMRVLCVRKLSYRAGWMFALAGLAGRRTAGAAGAGFYLVNDKSSTLPLAVIVCDA
jgi:hypothetical protein